MAFVPFKKNSTFDDVMPLYYTTFIFLLPHGVSHHMWLCVATFNHLHDPEATKGL